MTVFSIKSETTPLADGGTCQCSFWGDACRRRRLQPQLSLAKSIIDTKLNIFMRKTLMQHKLNLSKEKKSLTRIFTWNKVNLIILGSKQKKLQFFKSQMKKKLHGKIKHSGMKVKQAF